MDFKEIFYFTFSLIVGILIVLLPSALLSFVLLKIFPQIPLTQLQLTCCLMFIKLLL